MSFSIFGSNPKERNISEKVHIESLQLFFFILFTDYIKFLQKLELCFLLTFQIEFCIFYQKRSNFFLDITF